MRIAALTIRGDIHAHAIRHELRTEYGVDLSVIEVDRLSSEHHINWQLNGSTPICRVWCDNQWLPIGEIDLIWWRRSRAQQEFDNVCYTAEQEEIINNDCRSSLAGGLTTCFDGFWLSHPIATERAGNKLFQLSIAKQHGFRVPETLISQDPESVRSFVSERSASRAIVKTVAGGGKGLFLFTQFVGYQELESDDSIRVCPAIYQEYIQGDTHIRLNCFGDRSHAGRIITKDLDWRPNLNVPVSAWDVPHELHLKVRKVLDAMGLEMGIVDFKVTSEGEFVWLEVNPQGQFLFLEPLTTVPYTRLFAEYLISCVGREQKSANLDMRNRIPRTNNGEQGPAPSRLAAPIHTGK